MAEYPRRESHFAHKLIRLMIRVCAAQEIGTDGFLLVTVIAHTEDAKRYTGPVTFWNDQLASVAGFASWGKLDRARKRAVDSGWLHYEPGTKGKVGKYWATVPNVYAEIPDGAADCDYPHAFASNSEEENVKEPGDNRDLSGGQPRDNRGANGDLSTLTLNLDLNLQEQPTVVCSDQQQAAGTEPPASQGPDAEAEPSFPPEPSPYSFPVTGVRVKGRKSRNRKGAEPKPWNLPAAKLAEYRESYPALDVDAEMRKARQWCIDNPKRRKTPGRGMLSFLTGWLNRQTNRLGGGNLQSDTMPDAAPKVDYDFDAYLESQKLTPKVKP